MEIEEEYAEAPYEEGEYNLATQSLKKILCMRRTTES